MSFRYKILSWLPYAGWPYIHKQKPMNTHVSIDLWTKLHVKYFELSRRSICVLAVVKVPSCAFCVRSCNAVSRLSGEHINFVPYSVPFMLFVMKISVYNEENMRGINIQWYFTVKNSGHIMKVACLSTLKASIGMEH